MAIKSVKDFSAFDDLDEKVVRINQGPPIEIEIEKLSEVRETKINWLWKDKIAFGKMTLFAGEPGVGKSQLLLYIASIVSKGENFHFDYKKCDASNVLLISGEDNSDDTLKPRLMALNANLDRIHNVKGIKKLDKNGHPFFDAICLIENLADIENKIIQNDYKLIIIDPISVYLGSIDENKNKEIRSALSMLSALAERHNIALVLNSHFSKPSGSASKNAIYRVMGSIGFAAAARIVFGIMKDPENPERRLFLPIKNNIGPDTEGYVYQIKPIVVGSGIETSRVDWLNEKVEKTANEILNAPTEKSAPRLEEAKDFLIDLLKFNSMPLAEITAKFLSNGFGKTTLYKAKNELKILEVDSISSRKGKIWMLSQ